MHCAASPLFSSGVGVCKVLKAVCLSDFACAVRSRMHSSATLLLQVTFIMGQLKQHVEAGKLLEELQAVLDEEAPGFVLKLFRSVIFDTEKQALGLLEG